MAHLEIKKMKQGMSYSCKEKTIILNVFKYFRIQFPEKCVTEIVRRTAKATGCSEKSIFQFRKEEASAEGFKVPSTTKIRRNININSRDIKYDNTVRQAIRNVIYDLKHKNIVPSLNTILKRVNADEQLPNFSLMTLRRLMFDMGFCYEKNGNKSFLVEKPQNSDSIKNKNLKKDRSANKECEVVKPPMESDQNQTLCQNIPLVEQAVSHQQNHKILPPPPPMHNPMLQHDNSGQILHNMHMPHHSMPMMLNHRVSSHQIMPQWMHHPHPLMKPE